MKINVEKHLRTMQEIGPMYAAAKANRIYIEESLRAFKALEMQRSIAQTISGKEMDAYASDAYRRALEGLKAAVESEETFRWQLTTASAAVDVWRSQEASNRALDRGAS